MVQIYVNDIIFRSIDESMSHSFVQTMKLEFEMSMEGELKFFLGLQIRQTENGIFVNWPSFPKTWFQSLAFKRPSQPKPPHVYKYKDLY